MPVIVESFCKGCSNSECFKHQEKKILEDSVTGLVIEARCICKHNLFRGVTSKITLDDDFQDQLISKQSKLNDKPNDKRSGDVVCE